MGLFFLLLLLLYPLLVVVLPSIGLSRVSLHHILLLFLARLTLELLLACLQDELGTFGLIYYCTPQLEIILVIKVILENLNLHLIGLDP